MNPLVALSLGTHYSDLIMSALASQITGVSVVWPTVCSGSYQRKHQSSASLSFVRGIHWWPGQQREKCFHLMTSSWLSNMGLSQCCHDFWQITNRWLNIINTDFKIGPLMRVWNAPCTVDCVQHNEGRHGSQWLKTILCDRYWYLVTWLLSLMGERSFSKWRHQMETFFRVTVLLCGEFTGHRWIPRTKASDAELWCFIWSVPEHTIK